MRNDCRESIASESISVVMHQTKDIVFNAKIRYHRIRIHIEIVFHSLNNILPCNRNVFVTLRRTLHVIESERMQEFMCRCTVTETTSARYEKLKIQLLASASKITNL